MKIEKYRHKNHAWAWEKAIDGHETFRWDAFKGGMKDAFAWAGPILSILSPPSLVDSGLRNRRSQVGLIKLQRFEPERQTFESHAG